MRYVLALSHSAFMVRHWFEINLDDASFDGNEPRGRVRDAGLSAGPWSWPGDQVASLGTVSDHGAWPVDPADAAEIRSLAGTVVATARQFEASRCTSEADCYQLTRDVQDTVRLMIAALRNPGLLGTGWV